MTFVDYVTPVPADWLNNVNTVVNGLPPVSQINNAITFANSAPSAAALTTSVAHTSRYDQKNILDYGGVADGVTDNSAAFTAALAACPTGKTIVYFPPGNFFFAHAISFSHPTNPVYSSYSLIGAGMGATQLIFPSGSDGITVTHNSLFDHTEVRGMTILTKGVGLTRGILITLATGLTGALDSSVMLFDLNLRGADGFVLSQYWGFAVEIFGVSNANVYNCNFSGITTSGATGVLLVQNAPGQLPVVFNFHSCQFNYLGQGVQYTNGVQGVTFTACNFTGCNWGILAPAGQIALDQLSVVNSQFNCFLNGIFIASRIGSINISNSFFLVQNSSAGISLQQTLDYTIIGNSFEPTVIPSTATIGISISDFVDTGGNIVGNTIQWMTNGINLGATSQFVNVQSNTYGHCNTNVVNNGTNNTVGGGSA